MKVFVRYLTVFIVFSFTFINGFAQVKRVDAIGITVSDMNTSIKFYGEVLGFRKISDAGYAGDAYEKLLGVFGLRIRVVKMQLGDEIIELTDYLTVGGRRIPEDAKSNDLSFQHIAIVVSDMDKAYAILRKFNVAHVSTGPQTLPVTNVAAAGIKAFYFQDPDRHNLELIYFPRGKGQKKWQSGKGEIFLGIDHTAIGISDTEISLNFYTKLLGVDRKGESFNNGTEQEHLNNVEGASLHITGLRAAMGPGIEFLQYLQPEAGKTYPADTKANDTWFWQTKVWVDDIETVFTTLRKAGAIFVSQQVVEVNIGTSKKIKAFIVRDPDGHAVMVEEEFDFAGTSQKMVAEK